MVLPRLNLYEGRSLFLKFFFALLFIFLVFRLLYLQLFDSSFLDRASKSRIVTEYVISVPRGAILDRHNKYLALDVSSHTLQLEIRAFKPSDDELKKLLSVLGMNKSSLLGKLELKGRKFIQVKRHLSSEEKKSIEKIGIKGMSFLTDLKRSYPQGEISAHAVGITDIDRNGLQGTEKLFDNYLKSTSGKFVGLRDRRGNKLDGLRVEAKRGKDVKMTLDIRLQSIAYSELASSIVDSGAKSGSIIMVDPVNSEILAMVNFPSFTPSNRKELSDFSLLRNRSAIDLFEPGSVMKPLAMAAIIDSKIYDNNLIIETSPGWIDYEGYITKDFRDYGKLNLSEIISRSSNVGMVKLCSNMEKNLLYDYLSMFSVGKYPSSILINSREGFLSYTDAVTERDKVSACYGYGMSVTAIHLAQAYSILAAKGIYKELKLFKNIDNEDPKGKRVLSLETSSIINNMLVQAVNSSIGTGKKARINGISVSGKTGTSIKNQGEKNIYSAIFAGYAPSDQPKLVTIIALHGLEDKNASAGLQAAPIFSKVVEQSLHILDSGS